MGNADMFADDQVVAPAVFGTEEIDEDGFELEPDPEPAEATPPAPPEQVFVVPSEPVTPPQGDVTVQLGRTEDDELVMLAFSTSERLAACLGNDQPWVAIPKAQLEQVRHARDANFLEIDPVLPAG